MLKIPESSLKRSSIKRPLFDRLLCRFNSVFTICCLLMHIRIIPTESEIPIRKVNVGLERLRKAIVNNDDIKARDV